MVYSRKHKKMNPKQRIERHLIYGEPKKEYHLQKRISEYMNRFYPNIEYRVDMAGVNLSKAASGKLKAVNKRRAWHDFEIYNPSGEFSGLVIELKVAGTRLVMKKDSNTKKLLGYKTIGGKSYPVRETKTRKQGDWENKHIEEQAENLAAMAETGRCAAFGVGLENTLYIIEGYLNNDFELLEKGMIEQDFARVENILKKDLK